MSAGAPVGLVILAAGRGTRFGAGPKMLALLDGKPLVRHVAEVALAAGLGPVVAVLGHAAPQVATALDGLDLKSVVNPDYADGLSTSLKAAFAALPAEVAAAIVLLGDMPLVSAALLRDLAATFRGAGEPPAAVVPVRGGKRGNPVLLNLRLLAVEIEGLAGDRGAGPLLAARTDVIAHPVEAEAVLIDVDTPQLLAELQAGSG